MTLDLNSKASVTAFASDVTRAHPKIAVLVNNAAIVPKTRETSEDGIEKQFAVNVLSYFLLMVGSQRRIS